LLVLVIGCGESTPTAQPVSTIRDSAGIRIIENSSLALADSTSWIVDRANVVNIGERCATLWPHPKRSPATASSRGKVCIVLVAGERTAGLAVKIAANSASCWLREGGQRV
jgi:hypothetical protein